MATLVLLRHGQSTWNAEGRFTGWWDVGLTGTGETEARSAGALMREEGLAVDVAHTSVLTRAIRTLQLAMEEMGRLWVPVRRHWRLNERHYGALTGLDKAETKAAHGEVQFRAWRRSFDISPPPMERGHRYDVVDDPRYAWLAPGAVPATECLAEVVTRMLPYWYDAVAPDLFAERVVLIAAHGNSLRALVKHLEGVSDQDITQLEIPTGVPIVYQLDGRLRPVSRRELGDPLAIAAATLAVRRQGERPPPGDADPSRGPGDGP